MARMAVGKGISRIARAGFLTRILAIPVLFLVFSAFGKRTTLVKQPDPLTAQTDTSAEAIIRRAPHPITTDDYLLRFYLKHLRYPETAIQQRQEGTISFSIKVGEQNQLLEFKSYAEGELTGEKFREVTVTARAKDEEVQQASTSQDQSMFTAEAKKGAKLLAKETNRSYGPGEYFFTVKFKLEYPANKLEKPASK